MLKKRAQRTIRISAARQRLVLREGRKILRSYQISTSRFGLGEKEGSHKTPRGKFRIAEKIGAGLPITTAFKSRKPVRLTPALLRAEDLIMARILWLEGLEAKNSNSYARYIYLHGTNQEDAIGTPASHGCVRMRNAEVAELFDLVEVGTPVFIQELAPRKRHPKKLRKALRRSSDQPK